MMKLPMPALELTCRLTVELAAVKELGQGRAGQRRIIPIIGGTFDGPRMKGRVLDVGADWQTIWQGGMAELDTRYALETDDGAVIEVINYGLRHGPADVLQAVARGEEVDPNAYYMRTQARLETGDARYDWVNGLLFVGTGARHKSAVSIDLYAVV